MIWSITYGNERYERAKKLNCKTAKKYGADKVIAYGPQNIAEDFKKKNSFIWNQARGGGYWLWKPYIMLMTLEKLNKEDYLVYTDAGAIFVDKISKLINCMEKEGQDIMVFSLALKERAWTKRDTFLLLECDKPEFTDSMQILSGYVILKKTDFVKNFLEEWLFWLQDARAVTDQPNCLGKENYPEFIENRHDQSILSLLCKKYGIKPFRDPSQFGEELYCEEVCRGICERSEYPQIIISHRNGNLGSLFQMKYENRKWYKYITYGYYKGLLERIKQNFK